MAFLRHLPFVRRSPEDGEQLVEARRRIRHVVVLMLENRSFDHLLGYLSYPGFPTLVDDSFPNSVGGADAASVGVSHDAKEILRLDPPHSHVSVKQQMHPQGAGFAMDGFISAYARKLRGDRDPPVFHWIRIELVAIVAAALAAVGIADLARRAGEGIGSLAVFALPVLLLLLPLRVLHRLRALKLWQYAVLVLVVGLLAAGVDGVIFAGSLSWGLAAILAGLLIAAVSGLVVWRRSVVRKVESVPEDQVAEECKHIMRCMDPDRIRVLAMLAEQFAVCTRWHSSVPGATWPNRNFAHAATSEDTVDIEIGLYGSDTVFEMLERAATKQRVARDDAWRIYHDGMAQTLAFHRLWDDGRAANWHPMSDFFEHVRNRDLPWYSFIEPHHSKGDASNSQHPGNNEHATGGRSDFHRGELLVREIYEALRGAGDLFDETMLVITYDEHGGLFDHVPPPRAKRPTPLRPELNRALRLTRRVIGWLVENRFSPFDFRRLGVRVPAIVISPWIDARTIESQETYDHSSIVATLRTLFAPGESELTARDKAATPFHSLALKRAAPRTMPPTPEPAPPEARPRDVGPRTAAPRPAPLEPARASTIGPKASVDGQFDDQLGSLEHELRELTVLGLESAGEDVPERIDVVDRFVSFARDERTHQDGPTT